MTSPGAWYGLRVMGMAGAYTGVSENIEGVPSSLVSLANRAPHQVDWFDWDATLTWLIPQGNLDLDNDICPSGGGFQLISAGGLLRFGRIGVGYFYEDTDVASPIGRGSSPDSDLSLVIARHTIGAAWALPGDAWVLGAGIHVLHANLLEFDTTGEGNFLGGGTQVSFAADMLWRPPGRPWRVGLAARTASVVPFAFEGLASPIDSIVRPWELRFGLVWWLGDGELNPHVFRGADLNDLGGKTPRTGLLIAMDIFFEGPTLGTDGERAVGLEAYNEGWLLETSDRVVGGVRVGVETEAVPGWVRLRGGYWIEPSHFDSVAPRVHLTGGLDVRLFTLWDYTLKASYAFDAAFDYLVSSLSLGIW